MKYFSVIAALCLSCGSTSDRLAIPAEKNNTRLKAALIKVEVESVNFNVLTFAPVECDEFGGGMVKHHYFITDADKLSEIEKRVEHLKRTNKQGTPDIRAKTTLYYSDRLEVVICTDGLNMLLNGEPVQMDTTLVSMLGISME